MKKFTITIITTLIIGTGLIIANPYKKMECDIFNPNTYSEDCKIEIEKQKKEIMNSYNLNLYK